MNLTRVLEHVVLGPDAVLGGPGIFRRWNAAVESGPLWGWVIAGSGSWSTQSIRSLRCRLAPP